MNRQWVRRKKGKTQKMSTDTVAVNNDTSALAAQVEQPNSVFGTVRVPALVQSVNQVFTTHFYQRLPHPLSHLIKELPVVDGTDVNLLCDFMTQVLKIRQVGQMAESTIYEIMYPCCRENCWPLLRKLLPLDRNLKIVMHVC